MRDQLRCVAADSAVLTTIASQGKISFLSKAAGLVGVTLGAPLELQVQASCGAHGGGHAVRNCIHARQTCTRGPGVPCACGVGSLALLCRHQK
eukprot:525773-Pleurochrysis_carterae.AAC.3